MNKKRIKKKKLNLKRTLIFLLVLYVLVFSIYYTINKPIKHIEIIGNNLVSDKEIIKVAKIKNYPPIFKYSNKKLKKRIESLDLINEVKVQKKLGFILSINVNENKPLFYYINEKKVVLSNGDIINNENKIMGIPTLAVTMDSKILLDFVNSFKSIDDEIIYEMSEITYTPNLDGKGKIIDEQFTILMNDGNTIITTTKKCNLINKYNEIYASLNGKLGTLHLSSGTLDNLVFIPYGG